MGEEKACGYCGGTGCKYCNSPLVFRLPDGSTRSPTPELVAEFKRQALSNYGEKRETDGVTVPWDTFMSLAQSHEQLTAALARAEKAERERDYWEGNYRALRDHNGILIHERDEAEKERDEARAECARLRDELDAAHRIEAELITLRAQDRLDPLRLEMAEAETNGLRLLHESDKARIATLEEALGRIRDHGPVRGLTSSHTRDLLRNRLVRCNEWAREALAKP